MKILKYPITDHGNAKPGISVALPMNCKILKVGVREHTPTIWVLGEEDAPEIDVVFEIYHTYDHVSSEYAIQYINSVDIDGQSHHIFYRTGMTLKEIAESSKPFGLFKHD